MNREQLLSALALKTEMFPVGDDEVELRALALNERVHIGDMHKTDVSAAEIRAQVLVYGCPILTDDDVEQLVESDPLLTMQMEQAIYRLSGLNLDNAQEAEIKND